MKNITMLLVFVFAASLGLFACNGDDDSSSDSSSSEDEPENDDDDTEEDSDDDQDDDDADDDSSGDDDEIYWDPATVVPIGVHPGVRGFSLLRTTIHLHSVYSHDACDNLPWVSGHPNWACLQQLRDAICETRQQFIMLTDHSSPFAEHEFPDVLLYDPEAGDELIYEDDLPFANRMHCPNGGSAVITAGNENALMPVSLRRMPDGTTQERIDFLRGRTPEAVNAMRELGATVFIPHSEGWETEEILALPVAGIEIYNTHANIDPGIREDDLGLSPLGFIFDVIRFLLPAETAGHSDLVLLPFLEENRPGLDHWDELLAQRHTVGVMGNDAHRNTLPFPLYDGERMDSYRRMLRWFANYVLAVDDSPGTVQEAVARGRFFGAFQVFGEPVGFDFHAESSGGVTEMGDEIDFAENPVLVLKKPVFHNMDPALPEPEFHLQLIMAGLDGGAVVAESIDEDISFPVPVPGAYRAEVHVVPHHLRPWLGADGDDLIRLYPLIYANAIYVVD